MEKEGLRLLRFPEVLDRVGLSAAEIKRRMDAGKFPRSVPLGERARAWSEEEIDSWIRERIAERDAREAEAA